MLVQHPQVELHQVPADDRVGVVGGQPGVEPFEQLAAAVAVLEVEVDLPGVPVGRAEHVHLPLAAALKRDGIELATGGGLDVQRDQLQARPIGRHGPELGDLQRAVTLGLPVEPHGRGDEALHEIALRRADIGLVDVDARGAQALFQLQQLAVLAAVQPEHRPLAEIAQLQRAQLDTPLAAQHGLGGLALCDRNEGGGHLIRHPDTTRPVIGRQPELDFGACRRVAPMAGEDEALLLVHAVFLGAMEAADCSEPGPPSPGYDDDRIDRVDIH